MTWRTVARKIEPRYIERYGIHENILHDENIIIMPPIISEKVGSGYRKPEAMLQSVGERGSLWKHNAGHCKRNIAG